MHSQTVAAQHPPDNTTSPKPKRTGQKSPWRVLHERLMLAEASPVARSVALALEAYARQEQGSGRMVAAVFHAKLAHETNMSVSSVRRALNELTTGDAPLYVARGRDGQVRTFRYNGGSRSTRAVFYERIDDLAAFLAARDTARTANVLDFEQRQREHRPELLAAQRQVVSGEITQAEYQATVEQIDARARGRLPKAAAAHKPARCLTPAQLERLARDLFVDFVGYADLKRDGGDRRLREFHALNRHLFGAGTGEWTGCAECQAKLAEICNSPIPVKPGSSVTVVGMTGWLKEHRAKFTRCGCGVPVLTFDYAQAIAFSEVVAHRADTGGLRAPLHDCPHELNRLVKLRAGRL